jgi:Fur family peroxide stress response transcriptional regulator
MNTVNRSRLTRQRRAILDLLKSTRAHPTADDIYDEVRKDLPNISKGTVYRNLQVLIDRGEAAVLDIRGSLSRYELRRGSHCHFRCQACERVIDIDEPVDPGLDAKVSRETGFVVSGHQIEFRGWCAICRQPSQNTNKES